MTKQKRFFLLTSKISATIDQLRLRATSPRKTKAKPMSTLVRAKKNATKIKTDERTRPSPQIRGSDLGYFSLRRVLSIAPSGTPIMPETIVTAPKISETLFPTKTKGTKKYKTLVQTYTLRPDHLKHVLD